MKKFLFAIIVCSAFLLPFVGCKSEGTPTGPEKGKTVKKCAQCGKSADKCQCKKGKDKQAACAKCKKAGKEKCDCPK